MDSFSLAEIVRGGEALYLNKFRQVLERECHGRYAVIDVVSEQYVTDEDKVKAFEKATAKFGPDKLFYVTRVGDLTGPTMNFKDHARLSWSF